MSHRRRVSSRVAEKVGTAEEAIETRIDTTKASETLASYIAGRCVCISRC